MDYPANGTPRHPNLVSTIPEEFDETAFKFTLMGSNPSPINIQEYLHTSVIQACGTYLEGNNTGQAVALNCTWYNIPIDKEDELIEIPGIKGACYSTSIADIGHKIFVHAIPASD